MAKIKTPQPIKEEKNKGYIIKRKSLKEPFKCPICKEGELEWTQPFSIFSYKCLGCGKGFM